MRKRMARKKGVDPNAKRGNVSKQVNGANGNQKSRKTE
jgi:hypothetical protein